MPLFYIKPKEYGYSIRIDNEVYPYYLLSKSYIDGRWVIFVINKAEKEQIDKSILINNIDQYNRLVYRNTSIESVMETMTVGSIINKLPVPDPDPYPDPGPLDLSKTYNIIPVRFDTGYFTIFDRYYLMNRLGIGWTLSKSLMRSLDKIYSVFIKAPSIHHILLNYIPGISNLSTIYDVYAKRSFYSVSEILTKYTERNVLINTLKLGHNFIAVQNDYTIFDLNNMELALVEISNKINHNATNILAILNPPSIPTPIHVGTPISAPSSLPASVSLDCILFPLIRNNNNRVSDAEIYKGTDVTGEYLIKLEDATSNFNRWGFWQHVINKLTVKYFDIEDTNPRNRSMSKEIYTDKKYMAFDWKVFYDIITKIRTVYDTLYNSPWLNSRKPRFFEYDPDRDNTDPVFAEKLIITHPSAQVVFIGDIHSSLHSLYDIINDNRDKFEGDTMKLKPDNYIIFLGDLIDRGPYSMEILLFVFNLKFKNPTQVYIINGNHEDYNVYELGGTFNEFQYQFNIGPTEKTDPVHDINEAKKEIFRTTMHYLPSVIYLNFKGNWYHLSHGGMPMPFNDMKPFLDSPLTLYYWGRNDPNNGYKWTDFTQGEFSEIARTRGFDDYDKGEDRGALYNPKKTKEYLNHHNIKSIISGHQDQTHILLHVDKEDLDPSINVAGYEFKLCSFLNDGIIKNAYCNGQSYLLYGGPAITKDIKDKIIVRLNPNIDFLAIRTSTATISRGIRMNNYLLLH